MPKKARIPAGSNLDTRSDELRALLSLALLEDIGTGDITSESLIDAGRLGAADIIARRPCVVCGGQLAGEVFRLLDPSVKITQAVPDGRRADKDSCLMKVSGGARAILAGERTALNFMQKLTGIATLTAAFVERVKPYGTAILDTRKTTPTLRSLEKYAVRCGGGLNHRMGLYDRVLIKDNHRALWGGKNLGAAVSAARCKFPDFLLEVEVESEQDLPSALAARPDWILLDNMPIGLLRKCVRLCRGRCFLEASGGVTLANAASVAATGVDAISIGALTSSAPAADLSLEMT